MKGGRIYGIAMHTLPSRDYPVTVKYTHACSGHEACDGVGVLCHETVSTAMQGTSTLLGGRISWRCLLCVHAVPGFIGYSWFTLNGV
jgi:hypothetical protein